MCKKPRVMWSPTNCSEYFWTANLEGLLLSVHCQLLTQAESINIERESSIPGACLESMNLSLLIQFFFLKLGHVQYKTITIYTLKLFSPHLGFISVGSYLLNFLVSLVIIFIITVHTLSINESTNEFQSHCVIMYSNT